MKKGEIEIDNLIIFAYPDCLIFLEFISNLIPEYNLDLQIYFRKCQPGEIIIQNAQ